ncbi:MAG: hypothetical protein IJT21_00135 [Synergistaceae bacterium]|nr:hypothetical protein [Synergistaceae bacterium]
MRRFIICVLIIALISSSACAEICEFKYFSLNIPEGWSASEKILENGSSMVAVLPDDDNIPGAIAITSGSPGNLTIKEIAENYSKNFNGTTPESGEDGIYIFEFNEGKSFALIDGDENFYMFTAITATDEESETNKILLDILDSMELK